MDLLVPLIDPVRGHSLIQDSTSEAHWELHFRQLDVPHPKFCMSH
jgi:hypothetical protein